MISNIQGLFCHELIFCKRVNLQKPKYWDKVRMRVTGAQDRADFLKWGHFDKHFVYDIQKKSSAWKKFVFFLQDTLKAAFQMSI